MKTIYVLHTKQSVLYPFLSMEAAKASRDEKIASGKYTDSDITITPCTIPARAKGIEIIMINGKPHIVAHTGVLN